MLQCMVVTPEKAILDEQAELVVLPMIDGELGVQSGRSALVGRLGKGQLRLTHNRQVKILNIEGGFAQVRSNVITVLTSKVTG
ncbi:MAG: hypothetical protein R3B84_07535 [Zavarzinella sp.]